MFPVCGRRPRFEAATAWTMGDEVVPPQRHVERDQTGEVVPLWWKARGCPGKEARWGWQGRDVPCWLVRPKSQEHGTTTMGRHLSIQSAGSSLVVRRSFIFCSIQSQGETAWGQPGQLSETGSRPLPCVPLRSRGHVGFHARVLATAKGASRKTRNERRRSAGAVGGWVMGNTFGDSFEDESKALDPSCGSSSSPKGMSRRIKRTRRFGFLAFVVPEQIHE